MKTAKTIKPYTTLFFGHVVTVPEGSTVSNGTACGDSGTYRFWTDYHKTFEELTGFKGSIFAYDLEYHGLNVPAEYCEAYKGDERENLRMKTKRIKMGTTCEKCVLCKNSPECSRFRRSAGMRYSDKVQGCIKA